MLTATYLINRVPSRVLDQLTPFQCLSSYVLEIGLHTSLPLKVFGCVAFVHVSKHHRDKFDPQALRCVFLEYSLIQKGYKCYHAPTRKILVSKDVTFVKNKSFFKSPTSSPQGEIADDDHNLPFLEESQPCPSTFLKFTHSF